MTGWSRNSDHTETSALCRSKLPTDESLLQMCFFSSWKGNLRQYTCHNAAKSYFWNLCFLLLCFNDGTITPLTRVTGLSRCADGLKAQEMGLLWQMAMPCHGSSYSLNILFFLWHASSLLVATSLGCDCSQLGFSCWSCPGVWHQWRYIGFISILEISGAYWASVHALSYWLYK